MKLTAAGNTEIPALLALEKKGAEITCEKESNLWTAVYQMNTFIAESPLELLGLIEMYSVRGSEWEAKDTELERCGTLYPGLGLG